MASGLETSNKKSFKSFRKRVIVSNWQKYELPPDGEEKLSARGESYEKLLSMAGETISHFRFKDELAWDDPADSASENCSDTYSQFLCVNSTDIAQALTCLPAHQILGINQDVFPDEQLSSIMSMVKDRRSVYAAEVFEQKGLLIVSSDKDVPKEAVHGSRLLIEQDHENNQQENLNLKMKVQIDDPITSKQKTVSTTNSLFVSDGSVMAQDCQGDSSRTDIVAKEVLVSERSDILKKPYEKLHLQDDDLDAVLDLDNSAPDVAGIIKETTQNETITASAVSKNDANSILVQTSTASSDSKLIAESSDLEAWLDSILDD